MTKPRSETVCGEHGRILKSKTETKDIQWSGKVRIRPRGQGQWENQNRDIQGIVSHRFAATE